MCGAIRNLLLRNPAIRNPANHYRLACVRLVKPRHRPSVAWEEEDRSSCPRLGLGLRNVGDP
eukprot:2522153-Alexandrium_andersonii.AAC.1